MATVYYQKMDPEMPEYDTGVYVGIMPKAKAKTFVKDKNNSLTQEEKDNYVEYDYLNKDYSEEDFYNLK